MRQTGYQIIEFPYIFTILFPRGHFWRLLPAGKQVVEVKGEGFTPVTKLITIVPGE